MTTTWTVQTEEDENGNVILPIPEELMNEAGWLEGDELDFQVNSDGSCTITNISLQARNQIVV